MNRSVPAGESFDKVIVNQAHPGASMTLSKLRHDIRNYLNSIKLSSALLARQRRDAQSAEPLREIERSADGINDLITQYMGDADAPGLLRPPASNHKQEPS